MKRSQLGTSIVEVLVLIIILTSGILWMYTIYNKSQALSAHTAHKLQATSIVREGLEAVMNIRATNWMNFSADMANCWNVLDYKAECLEVGSPSTGGASPLYTAVFIWPGSYTLEIENENVPRWKLEEKLDLPDFKPGSTTEREDHVYNPSYVEKFRIKKMDTGFWKQGFTDTTDYKAPFFTREIQIEYDSNWVGVPATYPDETSSDCKNETTQRLCADSWNPQKMRVRSIVRWVDSASSDAHILKSEIVLTNRKR